MQGQPQIRLGITAPTSPVIRFLIKFPISWVGLLLVPQGSAICQASRSRSASTEGGMVNVGPAVSSRASTVLNPFPVT